MKTSVIRAAIERAFATVPASVMAAIGSGRRAAAEIPSSGGAADLSLTPEARAHVARINARQMAELDARVGAA